MPPPSARPATPVEPRKPEGVAMPNATVAWSTSAQVQPASTRTVWFSGLTVVLRRSDRSMTRASSHTARPATLWPPPRTAISIPCSWANRTQVMTSAVSRQRAMAAGYLSIMPLYTARAWSYSGSPGTIRLPRRAAATSVYGVVVVVVAVMSSPSGASVKSVHAERTNRGVRAAFGPGERALHRRGNAGNGKANVAAAEVTLAAPKQHRAAVLPRHGRGGQQARDGGLLAVIGGAHPHYLGQPPDVVVGAPGGDG